MGLIRPYRFCMLYNVYATLCTRASDGTSSTKHGHTDHSARCMDDDEALVEAFDPERIYLFGSYARGDAGPDSDYDLMIIVDSSDQPQYNT